MIKALAVGIIALGLLAGCDSGESNKSFGDIADKYDFADIRLFDGTIKTVRVVSWSDWVYNDHVTIHDADGVTWHIHFSNVILRKAAKHDKH